MRHREKVQGSFFGVIKPLGIALLIVVMLLAQPDFGSAALLLAVTLGMVWLGGARFSQSRRARHARDSGDRLGGVQSGLSRQAPHLVPRSVGRSVQGRLPAHAGADRDRPRRMARRRPRRLGAETFLSARGAHRFHSRGDRRGTRLRRHRARACAVRMADRARFRDWPARGRARPALRRLLRVRRFADRSRCRRWCRSA